MIPPVPAVNDAIGLLAVLGDAKAAKAMLDEIKQHAEHADEALAKTREAQTRIDADARTRDADRDALGKERLALAEEKSRLASWRTAKENEFGETARALEAREAAVTKATTQAANMTAALAGREQAIATREKALDARERAVQVRETKAEDIMNALAPLAAKLK